MLDKIAMITFLVVYIISLFIALFTYLIIRGGNESKTDEERFYEDEEQMNYIRNYKKAKNRQR